MFKKKVEPPLNGGGDASAMKDQLKKGEEEMECEDVSDDEAASNGTDAVAPIKQNGVYKGKACNGDYDNDKDESENSDDSQSNSKKTSKTNDTENDSEMETDKPSSPKKNGDAENNSEDNDKSDSDSTLGKKEENGTHKNGKDKDGDDKSDDKNGEEKDKEDSSTSEDKDRKSPTNSTIEISTDTTRDGSGTPDTTRDTTRDGTPDTTRDTTRDGTPASERSDTPTTQEAGTEPASGAGTPAEKPSTPTPEADKAPAPQAKYKLFQTCGDDVEDMRPMATILYQLGSNLCKEFVFKDLIHHQEKRKAQNKLEVLDAEGHPELVKLKDELAEKNDVYSMKTVQCDRCTFKSESENIVEWHKEFAHNQDENLYSCSFCQFETKFPGQFFYHMEAEHNRKGRIFMRPSFFNCPMCPFENSTKAALKKHLLKCEKTFNMKRNLEPAPTDCDIPIKKPKQVPKKLPAPKPIPPKPTQSARPAPQPVGPPRMATPPSAASVNAFQQQFQQMATRMGMPGGITMLPGPTPTYAIGNQVFRMVQQGTQFMLQPVAGGKPQPLPPGFPGLPGVPQRAGGMNTSLMNSLSLKAQQNAIANQLKQLQQAQQQAAQLAAARLKNPASSSTPPPAHSKSAPSINKSQPRPAHTGSNNKQSSGAPNKKANFEICEICGGFVKDRESLRIHFYWAHKVDIKKEIFEQKEPHLACNVCPQRFWTYQGYRWHQRMKHGNTALPPEGSQAAAAATATAASASAKAPPTKQVPTYFCAVCRSKTIRNLLLHLLKVHRITVDMVCDQKRCPMCGVTFKNPGNTRLHLYNSHKEMFREAPILDPRFQQQQQLQQQQQSKTAAPKVGGSPVPTGLFENSAKNRTPPAPVRERPGPKSSKPGGFKPVCNICDLTFPDVEMFTRHCSAQHAFPCHRCPTKWSTAEQLSSHFNKEHKYDKEKCQLCDDELTIGRSYIRHMKHSHLNECSLPMSRVKQSLVEEIQARYAREDEEERVREAEARKIRLAALGPGTATGLSASANATRKMGPRSKVQPLEEEVVILDEESPRKRPAMFPIIPKAQPAALTAAMAFKERSRSISPPPPQVASYHGNDTTYCNTCELEFPDNVELSKHNHEEHGIEPPEPQQDKQPEEMSETAEDASNDVAENGEEEEEGDDETMEIDGETITIQKADDE